MRSMGDNSVIYLTILVILFILVILVDEPVLLDLSKGTNISYILIEYHLKNCNLKFILINKRSCLGVT